jgi:hypothetical protein
LDDAGVETAFGIALRRTGVPDGDIPAIVEYGLTRFLRDLDTASAARARES